MHVQILILSSRSLLALLRLSAQYPRGSDGELPGIPEDDAVAAERDGPRPAQAPAHIRQSLQTGQEGT